LGDGAEEDEFDPDSFTAEDAERAQAEGAALFNAGQYHAAHEEFERCWLSNEGADADFFKGLIQTCICLHHLQLDNAEGARKLYAGHRRLLGPFLPVHRGIDVAALLAEMQIALADALRAGPGESVPFPVPAPQVRML